MTPDRLLVRLPNWLGDIVMALPAVGAIRGHFTGATLIAAAPAAFAPVLWAVPGVDEVVPLSGLQGTARVRADARALRAARAEVVVLFTNSLGSALAAWRAGVRERWGYRSDARGLLLTRAVSKRAARAFDASRHHSRYYVRLVRALGIDAPETPARIRVHDAWRARADRLLAERRVDAWRPLIGIAPGAAYGGAKRWPPRHVARLLARLLSDTEAGIVLVGAGADVETGHEIESALGSARGREVPAGRCVNLIGRTDLPTLVGVLGRCTAFVSNDSGAMHLAAAVGVHVTALFGPTREWATAPLGASTVLRHEVFCRPCMLRECPIDHRCMTRIAPDTVFESVVASMAGSRS